MIGGVYWRGNANRDRGTPLAAGGTVGRETIALIWETPLVVEFGYFTSGLIRNSKRPGKAPVDRCGFDFQKTLSMYGALLGYMNAPEPFSA